MDRPPVTLLALLLAVPAIAQSAPAPQQAPASSQNSPITTLHAATRLVLVDVVVTDNRHNPVHNLKISDFVLLEDKTVQPLKAFEEHSVDTAAPALRPTPPPGTFTNFSLASSNGPLNILLIDRLNTPMQNQSFLRQQLLDYIKTAKPGTRMAIFGLDQVQLRMLQGFTDDPDVLRAAISSKKNNPKASPLLDDPNGSSGSESFSAQMNEMIDPELQPGAAQLSALLKDSESVISAQQQQDRALLTLNAMHSLALFLSGIPGRKNLIWFSGSFPLDILPDTNAGDAYNAYIQTAFGTADNVEDQFKRITDMMARSQVAVYPVDARGLMVMPSTSVAVGNPQYVLNASGVQQDNINWSEQTMQEHTTMREMAFQTGGQAFLNTNALGEAVSDAIRDGASYYTLAYTPLNNNWNDDYRKIEVRLRQQGYNLSYRRGYYADDPEAVANHDATSSTHSAAMQVALIHGGPQASQIVFSTHIQASAGTEELVVRGNEGGPLLKPPYRRYTIGFGVDPHAMSFIKSDDGIHHASIEFVAFVYNAEGKVVNAAGSPVKIDFTDAQLLKALKGGIPFLEEISVPVKGDHFLRIAVHDLHNDRVGSLEVPVAVLAHTTPTPAPAKP